jgi:hypothetical protein
MAMQMSRYRGWDGAVGTAQIGSMRAVVVALALAAACTGPAQDHPAAPTAPLPSVGSAGVASEPTPIPDTVSLSEPRLLGPNAADEAAERRPDRPLVLTTDAARWIGYRRKIGEGNLPWIGAGGRWHLFLYDLYEPRGVAVGFSVKGRGETIACCLEEAHGGAHPLVYIPIVGGGGALLVHVADRIEEVEYDCFQCSHVNAIIPRFENGRSIGVPQIGVLFITARAKANDGDLVAFRGPRVFDRDQIGLPPRCATRKCPRGLAWGVLELGDRKLVAT